LIAKTLRYSALALMMGMVFFSQQVCVAADEISALVEAFSEKADYIYVEELDERVVVFPTVFRPDPYNKNFRQMLAGSDLKWAKQVLEIGTGSGVNALIALKSGAGHVTVTDINENAVYNSRYNAQKFGWESELAARRVPMSDSGAFSVIKKDEKFDLILFNPPWFNRKPKNIAEYALYDENYQLHRSFVSGLADHLTKNGKAWVELGHHKALELIEQEAALHSLNVLVLKKIKIDRVNYTILEISASA